LPGRAVRESEIVLAGLKRITDWYLHTPPELPPGEARIHTGAKFGYSVWILIQAATAVVFLSLDQHVLAIFNAAGAALTVACFLCLLTGRPAAGFIAVNIQNIVGVVLTTIYTGLGTGFFLFAMVGLLYSTLAEWVSRQIQAMIIATSAAVFVGLLIYGLKAAPVSPLPFQWVVIFAAINGAVTAGMLLLVAITYRNTVDRAEAALEAEHAKSEALLHNIMPPAVAERLKENPEVIADSHKPVTIMFADIVGFTEMSSRSSPEALVKLLNTIFSRFDALVDAAKLEKIKTIGDAYMVVAGLPHARDDHAQAIARLALAMVAATDDVARETGEPLQIRVGVHSGAVVAGVIGQRKFAYDIWGDTVNVAARMESHGEAGRIQISADTAEFLDGGFVVEPRGEIEVKGKGMMAAYFLVGEREAVVAEAG